MSTNMARLPAVPRRNEFSHGVGLLLFVLLMCVTLLWHVSMGAKSVSFVAVFEALVAYDSSSFDHMVVRELRLPRAIIALVVGASLSVAGALMQGVTRNPLAEPGILGLMAGASFAVVFAVGVFSWAHPGLLPWVAALGALLAALLVWSIASFAPGGVTPLTLTLSGSAVTVFLGALITVAHLLNQDSFEQLRVWLAGSLATRRTEMMPLVLPVLGVSIIAALSMARQVTVFSMGDEMAKSLGVKTTQLRVQALLVVIFLTAGSVTLAGPLGFVGLVIPHVVRLFVGSDYRWIVPYSAVLGACYLLGVDTFARLVIRPQEIATGIVTALIGAPLFIHLVRKRA